ncbi:MAG: ribosome-associated translation inhibitor RaiA [Hyphomicrobiaceae bacterium]|nr:ribosome-associated translation inhibitor RaiA [Hyphomicrobiaceae bacterium]
MTIQVTGKNVDAGDAYKAYILDKISTVLEKYIGPEISGHVRLEKEKAHFRTNCSIRLRTGLLVEAHGDGADAYGSADAAVERLEKRVRRYKRRLKNHHNGRDTDHFGAELPARDYTVKVGEDDEVEAPAEHPMIIAEAERGIHELTVSAAVMQLDLSENEFLVFRNAAHGGLNVVYRRPDGNIGWIDPTAQAAQGVVGAAMGG